MAISSESRLLPLLLLLLLLSITTPSLQSSVKPKALLLPISKDYKTSQYIVQIKQRTPLVAVNLTLDVGCPHLWVDCDYNSYVSSSYQPAHCNSTQCKLARGFLCHDCPSDISIARQRPGCNFNTCLRQVAGPTTVLPGEVTQDVLSVRSTDGRNLGPYISVDDFLFTCGSWGTIRGLADGVKGIAGLGRTATSMPAQFSAAFGFRNKFSICLSDEGVVFFGEGPFYMQPGKEISRDLSYTPLIRNPIVSHLEHLSPNYYIGVKAIHFNGKPVPVDTSLLSINESGHGGTMISTRVPYTVLETSIYRALVDAFDKAFSDVPRSPAVKPFELCFKASALGSTRVGPGVPQVELVLENDSVWTIFGANSMVSMGSDTSCFAFVDGGVKSKAAIVIGQHQMEHNFLEFDIDNSRLGFSSSLLLRQTTCSNFNFTSNA